MKSISHESIRRILRKEGFRIKKGKRFQYSNDPEFDKKKLLIDLKKKPQRTVWSYLLMKNGELLLNNTVA